MQSKHASPYDCAFQNHFCRWCLRMLVLCSLTRVARFAKCFLFFYVKNTKLYHVRICAPPINRFLKRNIRPNTANSEHRERESESESERDTSKWTRQKWIVSLCLCNEYKHCVWRSMCKLTALLLSCIDLQNNLLSPHFLETEHSPLSSHLLFMSDFCSALVKQKQNFLLLFVLTWIFYCIFCTYYLLMLFMCYKNKAFNATQLMVSFLFNLYERRRIRRRRRIRKKTCRKDNLAEIKAIK